MQAKVGGRGRVDEEGDVRPVARAGGARPVAWAEVGSDGAVEAEAEAGSGGAVEVEAEAGSGGAAEVEAEAGSGGPAESEAEAGSGRAAGRRRALVAPRRRMARDGGRGLEADRGDGGWGRGRRRRGLRGSGWSRGRRRRGLRGKGRGQWARLGPADEVVSGRRLAVDQIGRAHV